MQTIRKTVDKKTKRETKEDSLTKKQDEKTKKTVHSVSTPRNFTQKSTADIYARTNNANVKAPKKPSTKITGLSSKKDVLKSSPSSVSQNSSRSYKLSKMADTPRIISNPVKSTEKSKVTSKNITKKTLPINVTVNSPIVKRKLDMGQDKLKKVASEEVMLNSKKDSSKKVLPERQRTNTRTLDEAEIKVLTPDVVDNNAELLNLTKKLSAKPKAFYVDLKEDTKAKKEKSSDEEVSYEDDFESYESDFDSYHSEEKESTGDDSDDKTTDDKTSDDDDDKKYSNKSDNASVQVEDEDGNSKEERMLDSGNFELRDPRSANRSKPMDFISEASEEGEGKTLKGYTEENDKKVSLTDEGFQDMSSSVLSSIKTIHVDVLERPLFIDFTKSKENKRKRRIFKKLQQRAKDILSMVTLHEISYNLYEMAPIPYDLYMATFGRLNYTQTAVQTFDDGITEEVQTEEILYSNKWTQCPVEFSNKDIYLNDNKNDKVRNKDLDEFSFFTEDENEIDIDEKYKSDPLRIYLEQKDGAGPDTIMPIDSYKTKLKDNSYNVNKLRKFLKKVECRISNILSINTGNTDLSNLIKTSKFPFSAGYLLLSTKNLDKSFLKDSKIMTTVISETKNNLVITIHNKFTSGFIARKCVLCLWDLSVASREPLKILISTDNVKIGRFRGSTDGYFVGALEDGSIQLWDLSEQPTWSNDVAINEKSTKIVDVESKGLSQTEIDREWNLKNSTCVNVEQNQCLLQASSYTSSAMAVCKNETVDCIVGLEFMGNNATANLGGGRKIIRQICSLQCTGILTIWSIIQDKTLNTADPGKAFWSKLKLERNQTINLIEYMNVPINTELTSFNLNAAKKRLTIKRQEKNITKASRPKSAVTSDVDRPNSAASVKNKLLVENYLFHFWENGVVFNHLKVMNLKSVDNYLVAKNCGEVLCCKRHLGTIKVKKLCVANAASSITHLESSPHGLPYFLAGTNTGTVNLCSLDDFRVLLTLECGNSPSVVIDKCKADDKGRYISSVPIKTPNQDTNKSIELTINSMSWSHTNPFRIIAICDTYVSVWELTYSDMRAKCTSGGFVECCSTERTLALLTTEGEVQIHKLRDEEKNLDLFKKYVMLL